MFLFLLLFRANNTLSIVFIHEITDVVSFSSQTMHDLTCSQGFLGIQSLVQNRNHVGVCPKQTVLEIQVNP